MKIRPKGKGMMCFTFCCSCCYWCSRWAAVRYTYIYIIRIKSEINLIISLHGRILLNFGWPETFDQTNFGYVGTLLHTSNSISLMKTFSQCLVESVTFFLHIFPVIFLWLGKGEKLKSTQVKLLAHSFYRLTRIFLLLYSRWNEQKYKNFAEFWRFSIRKYQCLKWNVSVAVRVFLTNDYPNLNANLEWIQ